jgi:S1-C subfamily serine protease
MTAGIISALGRSLPVQNQYQRGLGGTYSIPDVIQTDAPINPGNSGGVLLNDGGQVIGVTSAIESTAGSNAGIGFAIPSNIVASVVPSLISSGGYDHPWIGILGTTLTSDLATAMGLPADQRGALVIDVTPGSPAEQAGLQGSNTEVTINGQSTVVGGDVIVAIDGQTVAGMDDLIAYLANNTKVGQTVTLTVLRNGNDMQISLTLGARPTGGTTGTTPQPNATQEPTPEATPQTSPNATPAAGAYLGIVGLSMTPELAQAMNLPSGQQGVLVEQVQNGSPADQAGLRGSYKTATVNGTEVLVGGDIITGIGSKVVTSMEDLRTWLQTATPGRTVALNILRDGVAMQLSVTPGQSPAGTS